MCSSERWARTQTALGTVDYIHNFSFYSESNGEPQKAFKTGVALADPCVKKMSVVAVCRMDRKEEPGRQTSEGTAAFGQQRDNGG